MVKRNVGYDIMRALSIFMVVAIHSNVAYLGTNMGSFPWYIVTLATSVCLVAVPLFFMVSGALLLDADQIIPIDKLFSKRIFKQALPFVVWSLIYVFARIVMGKISFTVTAFTSLLYEPAYYQFWFMYSLLAIYLLLPVLQAVVIKLSKRHLEYVLLVWLVFCTVFPVLERFVPGFAISGHVDLILCEGYVGYFLLGYYLRKYHSDLSWKRSLVLAILGITITGLLSVLEYTIFSETGYSGYFYQTYLTPFVAMSVIGLFTLIGNARYPNNAWMISAVKILSVSSIGVYYIHMLVITALEYVGLTGSESIAVLTVKLIVAYLVSLVGAIVISKIPYVRMILMGIGEKNEN